MSGSVFVQQTSELLAHSPYLGVFMISLWDRTGVPGALIAAAAATGFLHVELAPTLLLVIFGSFLGDHAFYFGGLWLAPRIAVARGKYPATGRLLDQASALLVRYPRTALIWGRFIPKAGKYLSGVAGLAAFPYSQFLPNALAGSIAYGTIFGTAAFFGGNVLIRQSPALQGAAVAAALAVICAFVLLNQRRRSRA